MRRRLPPGGLPAPRGPGQRRRGLAVLNGFGLSLGDSIIGLQALDAARALGALGDHEPVLFRRRPELGPTVAALYRLVDARVAAVRPLPFRWTGAAPKAVIDMRDVAFDPPFRGMAMIDYFLGYFGLDPASVPAALKRNRWLAPVARPRLPAGLGRYALVCPRASMALRDMPEPVHRRIIEHLLDLGLPVVTQGPVPAGFEAAPVRSMPRTGTLDALFGLVAGAVLVVSTDTATVHLADAFGVPCLAFFVTHRPEWRVRDYPLCRPIHVPAALPPALEFARDAADVAAARAAWSAPGDDLQWLDAAIAAFVEDHASGISVDPSSARLPFRSLRNCSS